MTTAEIRPTSHDSIQREREYVRGNLGDGVSCPCCGQLAKLYRRTLNSAMARALIAMVRLDDRHAGVMVYGGGYRWHYVKSLPLIQGRHGGGDFAKLRWWGLIAEMPKGDAPQRRTSGMWRVTDLGRRWVFEADTVPRSVLIFDGQVQDICGKPIGVREALGRHFDYSALMGRSGGHRG